jgi:hypothetical protein
MRTTLMSLTISAMLLHSASSPAKDLRGSAPLRDGSTKARAIIVTEPESTYVHWEHQYLRDHFPGHTYLQHSVIPDTKDENKGYDMHLLVWHGQKREIWFDISKPFQEFTRKHHR